MQSTLLMLVQQVMTSRLTTHLECLASLPPNTGAPASASLLQTFRAAQGHYPPSPGLQSLYTVLLQQALGQLMQKAAASMAALPVMDLGECHGPQEVKHQLLKLLGQVG